MLKYTNKKHNNGGFILILNDVLSEFLYEIQIKNYTPRTIRDYKNNLAKFFKYCESELEIGELEEITHININ